MKQIKLIDRSRATYEIPATRVIEVKLNNTILSNSSFPTKGSSSDELDELGTTSHGAIVWS